MRRPAASGAAWRAPSSPTVVGGATTGAAFTAELGASAAVGLALLATGAVPVGPGSLFEQAAAASASSGSVLKNPAGMAPPTCHVARWCRKKTAGERCVPPNSAYVPGGCLCLSPSVARYR